MKLGIPKGTRDFSPEVLNRRNHIFNTIRKVFVKYGCQQIETPVMENLDTLTGKYGEEGDQLIFKVLNSGDFFAKTQLLDENKELIPYKKAAAQLCEKALRYDLTIPFARYVVMHQNDITMPFKRYQIQPVWRADRPQRGRYREFYQCDADVVGSSSLLNEAELICIYDEALSNLGLKDFTVKINNRKILSGIADVMGKPHLITDMTVAIDKLDKIGYEGIVKELLERGFDEKDIIVLKPFIELSGTNEEKLSILKQHLSASELGVKGIEEIEAVFYYLSHFTLNKAKVELDITLARGLNYYTGAIFEVKSNEVQIGSIGGGGRYDDLTGMFGLKNVTGVGISFGADRIYDVMQELNLFEDINVSAVKILIANITEEAEAYVLSLLSKLRRNNISVELYPTVSKLQKQLKYADAKKIPYVILVGEEELASDKPVLKDMRSGNQEYLSFEEIVELIA